MTARMYLYALAKTYEAGFEVPKAPVEAEATP